MPIPNVATLYQKIASGSEGGHEFARFVKLLLEANFSEKGLNLIIPSDASGDYKKVDAYISGGEDHEWLATGFHFKFYPGNLNSNQKGEIVKSIEAAIEENKFIQKVILVTPEDWQKSQQIWFDSICKKYECKLTIKYGGGIIITNREIIHWGHTKLIELALRHDHVGRRYFQELFPFGTGKFRLVKFTIDCENSKWKPYNNTNKYDYQINVYDTKNLTTDPVFDFWFTNDTPDTYLLERLEIHIEGVSTQLSGIQPKNFLKTIGTLKHQIDFKKPINLIKLNNSNSPMIFEPNKPMRFKLQLENFIKQCPGNRVTLKIWFHFNNYSLSTDTFFFAF